VASGSKSIALRMEFLPYFSFILFPNISRISSAEEVSICSNIFVNSDEETKEFLSKENYYNIINGYKDLFLLKDECKKVKTPEEFIDGTNFEHLKCIFLFDRELKINTGEEILATLNNISILRKEQNDSNFENTRYILLSGNIKTLKIAFESSIFERFKIPLATNLNFVINRFWFKLNKGFSNKDFPSSFSVLTKSQIILSKILNDAKEEADKIVKSAEEKAKQKYDLEIKKVDAKKQTLLENARRERELLSDRIKSSANLKSRNEKLKAKQTVINKVIDKLKAKLVNMNESDYINYLNQNIDKSSIAGKELIVKKEFVDKVKQEFSTAKVKENEFVSSGFIIEENGIQENYTFEVKLDFMRDELEVEISRLLFS